MRLFLYAKYIIIAMKILREQINEALLSHKYSPTDINNLLFEQIKEFIRKNYKVNKNRIEIIQGKDIPIMNIKDDIKFSRPSIHQLTNELFEFGIVSGDFDYRKCQYLKSVNDMPSKIGGSIIK